MARQTVLGNDIPGLVEACDDSRLFGVTLTPVQRELLQQVEAGSLLHFWALGRRSGKTLLGALVALWFSTLRPDMAQHVRRHERRYSVCVATNTRQARILVEQAASIIEASPLLGRLVEGRTEDQIAFKTGTVLMAVPCTSRGGRGWAVQSLLMDETAHMMDSDGNAAAEPIFRALVPSTAQFGDDARVIVASSPYGLDGFFAKTFAQIASGELDGAVCQQRSTLAMRPEMQTTALELERQRDPEGYRSEYLAEFVAAGGAFLDANRVQGAAGREGELAPGEVRSPIGALDLGFVSDSTALAIVGRDKGNQTRLRLVLARAWKPELGPLGFGPTLDEIAAICVMHGVRQLFVDQHSAIAAVEHLARHGIRATIVPTTAQSKSTMFSDLKTRLYGGELELYDQPELLAELRRIETVTTPGAATVRIRRLGSSHGDLATALALCAWRFRGTGSVGQILQPYGRIPGVRRRPNTKPGTPSIAGVRAIDAQLELARILGGR